MTSQCQSLNCQIQNTKRVFVASVLLSTPAGYLVVKSFMIVTPLEIYKGLIPSVYKRLKWHTAS